MKRCFYLILTGIMFFALSGYWASAQEVSGPKMFLEERLFNSKEVKEGDVIEHTFQVFNQGDQVLEIKDVKPG